MSKVIYLDNQATTRCDPRVFEEMSPYFCEHYGNAASKTHAYGWMAENAVELGRERVAALIGAKSSEIVFTSGATEANNLALIGVARAYRKQGKHILIAQTEHPSVLDCGAALEREGFEIEYLQVDSEGLLSPERVAERVRDDTLMVSVMLANNEIGVIQPVAEIARRCKAERERVIVHSDAVQAVGKMPVAVGELGVDLLTLSAHKIYGPKGVGALWRRRRPRLVIEALMHGGGHESGLRSGTLPVPLIVGFGKAAELAGELLDNEAQRIGSLRDRLLDGLRAQLDGLTVNGSMEARVAGNLNLSFEGVHGDALVTLVRGLAFSTGSACSAASKKASHVLSAIADKERVRGAVRLGLGRFTTEEEVERAIELLSDGVRHLRSSLSSS